jgi:tRNA pseudouridine55 synthase
MRYNAMKRGQTDLSGILLVNKPSGISSHDVVNRLRTITGERRIGHAGTLDPLASGLLIIMIGPATRLSDYLLMKDKTYEAEIIFGAATDTDDATGKIIATAPIPSDVADPSYAMRALEGWIGHHDQMPPRYSAIKIDGQKAYDVARKGGEIPLNSRSIEVLESKLIAIKNTADGAIVWNCLFRVSKGTYIRSLARDIGVEMGTYAHILNLSRVASGTASLDDAYTLEELASSGSISIADRFADPLPLIGFPCAIVSSAGAQRVATGRVLRYADISIIENDTVSIRETRAGYVSIVYDDALIALYRRNDTSDVLEPCAVFTGGIHAGIR